MLIRQLRIEQAPGSGSAILSNAIAYSLEELLWRIDHRPADPGRADYEDFRTALYQKLLSGILNWEDAERLVRKTTEDLHREWPIEPAAPVGDLLKALVVNLFAEAHAEAQGKPAQLRTALTSAVAQCYVALGELARGRIWFARARDIAMAGAVDAGTLAELDYAETDLLLKEGRHEEAARIRDMRRKSRTGGDSALSPLKRAGVLQNKGIELHVAGRIADAIETLREGVSILGALAAETDPPSPDVCHTLSGTLSNLAYVYIECAENFEVLAAMRSMKSAGLPPRVVARIMRLGSPEALATMQEEMNGRVSVLLQAEFPDGITATALRARAAVLFREAIAKGVDYQYLCIQSRGLADVLLDLNDLDGAAAAADACRRYAGRIRSYTFMAAGSWVLAEVAHQRGDAASALQALTDYLQASIRDTVRSGSAPGSDAAATAAKALLMASQGADALTAILLAESSKAIPTAVSLIRAVPLQGGVPGPLKQLYEQREALRLRSVWEAGERLDAEMAVVEDAIVRARGELTVRDRRAASWHDATYLDISRPGPIRRLLAQLGPRTTYVGFVVDRNRLFAYAVWPDDQVLSQVALPSGALDGMDTKTLCAVLLQPLASRLHALTANDRLIISPCPELTHVPFGLLPFSDQPLCNQATISVVTGCGMFEACASRPTPALESAVAVGAPARPDAPDLPHAALEVEHLAYRLEAAGVHVRPVLSGVAATVPSLATRVVNADLIHLACHAVVPNDGSSAQLLLTPAPLSNDSGVLSSDRIFTDLPLKAGCHVNLAACRTSVAIGEGAYFAEGLVIAFLVDGASSVLATLWPLSDGPAAIFQTAYYEHLLSGLAPPFALAATQRAAIRGDLGEDLRQPGNYGGYVLHGVAANPPRTKTPA